MKKNYVAPEMTNLGEVMKVTQGSGWFSLQDLWRSIVNQTPIDDIHDIIGREKGGFLSGGCRRKGH